MCGGGGDTLLLRNCGSIAEGEGGAAGRRGAGVGQAGGTMASAAGERERERARESERAREGERGQERGTVTCAAMATEAASSTLRQ